MDVSYQVGHLPVCPIDALRFDRLAFVYLDGRLQLERRFACRSSGARRALGRHLVSVSCSSRKAVEGCVGCLCETGTSEGVTEELFAPVMTDEILQQKLATKEETYMSRIMSVTDASMKEGSAPKV